MTRWIPPSILRSRVEQPHRNGGRNESVLRFEEAATCRSWLMARSKRDEKPDVCPRCGSKHVATILYGLVGISDELEKKLEAGEITLGGCCISDGDPAWKCLDCEHRFGEFAFGRPSKRRNEGES